VPRFFRGFRKDLRSRPGYQREDARPADVQQDSPEPENGLPYSRFPERVATQRLTQSRGRAVGRTSGSGGQWGLAGMPALTALQDSENVDDVRMLQGPQYRVFSFL
jgi:hypothetical protein